MVEPKDRRILLIDSDPDSMEILSEALKWEGYTVYKSSEAKQAIDFIHSWNPDLIILDVSVVGVDGLKILADLKNKREHISTIFVSKNSETQSIVAALDQGAADYIVKPFDPQELLARVRSQLRIKDLNDQLRSANERLKELVDIDDLTGLFNMRSVFDRLDNELNRAKRFKRQVCVVMLDMDFFKLVNDGNDHLFGSYVLSEVGKIIKSCIRNIDIAARYGGDEFLIILTEANIKGAEYFCERLRKSIEAREFVMGKDRMKLTASLGLAVTHAEGIAVDGRGLVRAADHALYEAKRGGKNCVKTVEIPKDGYLEHPAESGFVPKKRAG